MRGNALRTASLVAGALIVGSLAWGLAPSTSQTDEASRGASPEADPARAAHAGHDHSHGDGDSYEPGATEMRAYQPRHDHRLAHREGEVPSRAEAGELEHQLEDFVVEGNRGLEQMAEEGYVDGSGTLEDPYVIQGFRVEDDLKIKDTSLPLVIENSYIEGQLTLNFVGKQVYVHHNHVHDLRVNENVQRDGPTTAGLFTHNDIEFVGQLRHFGGTFAHNDIGPRPDDVIERYLSDTGPATLPDEVVWNFDGYHRAHVHNNSAVGRVDVQLHGHFHGSCLSCPAHDHANPADFPPGNQPGNLTPDSRHSYRYHTLDFENNTIRAPEAGVPLRIDDEGHAGDDQTAASEPNAHLEDHHEHHQYVRVYNNTVRSGPLVFDIVNADDERHEGMVQQARVDLERNRVVRERPRDTPRLIPAYQVHAADNVRLNGHANAYTFQGQGSMAPEGYAWVTEGEPADTTGFLFHEVNASRLGITDTHGHNATYGVTLDDVEPNTDVVLADNRFDAEEEARHER